MQNFLIVLSTLLVLASPLVYISSILKGRTKPHRTTRFVLMIITLLSTAALWQSHSAALWLALASAWQGVIIFLLSLKRGVGGWSRLDISCLIIAMAGVIVWQITGQPIVGLCASIIADLVGSVPFYVKTYYRPQTENWQFFAMDTTAAVFSLLALETHSIYTLSYPIYIFLFNGLAVVLILLRRRAVYGKMAYQSE